MIKSLINLFRKPKFRLPQSGDKVTFSASAIKENNFNVFTQQRVFEVKHSYGNEKENVVILKCSTHLKTGEWRLLPKETNAKY